MRQNDIVIVLAAFAAYLILMVVVGAVYMKRTKNSEDYPWGTWTERMGGCFVCTGI